MQNEMAPLQQQLGKLEKAIAAQEGLRGVVPDVQVEAMLTSLGTHLDFTQARFKRYRNTRENRRSERLQKFT